MKAVQFHQYGGVDVLRYEDIPEPKPGPGEVLVRVHATSVNPIDWKIRGGYMKGFRDIPLPFTPGLDVSGEVVETGPGVRLWRVGDHVWGKPTMADGSTGTYAEYCVVKEADLALKPEAIDHIHAGATPLAGLTAWQGLFDYGELREGNRVLIHAGAGGVGSFAIQFAKLQKVWNAATASARNQDLLRELGSDCPIDYAAGPFEDVVQGMDAVLETMGGEVRERSWRTLRKGGVLVAVIGPPPSEDEAAAHGVRSKLMWGQSNRAQLDEIGRAMSEGKVKALVGEVLPLSEARRAHELSETHHAQGKIVLRVV
jgi:NADPH:quinone reductase-like Zn-dependent oxidoreductase